MQFEKIGCHSSAIFPCMTIEVPYKINSNFLKNCSEKLPQILPGDSNYK